jgi:apolipoprotein N-acyltransferase
MKGWRAALVVIMVCGTALALAAAARHGLIEPADVSARCDNGGRDAWCSVRAWIIQAFVHQRIGWAAWALAVLATVTAWRGVAGIALFLACAGMILYTTELSAPAAVLALLVFVRAVRNGQAAAPANASSNAQYDKA